MATLTLTKAFINLAATGTAVSAQTREERKRVHAKNVDVRTFAGGRQRAITQEGVRGEFELTLVLVTKTTYELLCTWIGQVVQVRDHRGQQFWGVMASVPVAREDKADITLYDVVVSIRVVTYSEAV